VAYCFSLVISIPLALIITSTPRIEKFLLPFFDILQSVPVLAFFPVIVLAFIKFNFFEGAAIFVLFMAMLWNLVFSMIGGLKIIPSDIISAATVFKARGLKRLWYITLPAIFPYIITGSLLAWAQGWNILIVAEVLHNYIPNSSPSQDLYGLGSLLVNASYQSNNVAFLASLVIMIIIIGILNFFVWQKLLHLAERYKFD
jgi:NitT/TauT family transport system permease protein